MVWNALFFTFVRLWTIYQSNNGVLIVICKADRISVQKMGVCVNHTKVKFWNFKWNVINEFGIGPSFGAKTT